MTYDYVAELLRRRKATSKPYLDGLFPQQRAFVDDPSRQKAALCTRRAGKTEGLAAWFLDAGEDCPGGLSIYIARSRNNARMILWPALNRISEQYGLDLRLREIDGQLMVELKNGHRIWLAGCKDQIEMDKFRGVSGQRKSGIRRAAVDEAQTFPAWLRTLVGDVLQPALLDQRGELALVGTPGPVPAGPFYEWTTGDGAAQWPTHHWSVLDNPYLPDAAEEIARLRAQNGWDDDNPTYQREWLGRWVKDSSMIVYPFDSGRNLIDRAAPEWQWFQSAHEADRVYVLGIDLGSSVDEPTTAFCLAGFVRRAANVFVLKAWRRADMTPSSVAAEILRIKADYRITKIVIDEGGLGSGWAREINHRFGFGVEPAKKAQKRANIDFVAGDLRAGVIKVDPWEARDLVDEWVILPWNDERTEPDPRFPDHLSDAALYCLREARTFYKPTMEGPTPGTPEAVQADMDKYKRELEMDILRRQRRRARDEARRLRKRL